MIETITNTDLSKQLNFFASIIDQPHEYSLDLLIEAISVHTTFSRWLAAMTQPYIDSEWDSVTTELSEVRHWLIASSHHLSFASHQLRPVADLEMERHKLERISTLEDGTEKSTDMRHEDYPEFILPS